MSNSSKFWRLAALVPQVQRPDQPIPFRQKADPLYWLNLILASNRNTLLAHGIVAILVPEIVMKFVVPTEIAIPDTSAPGTCILLNGAQKLLGILITVIGVITFYVQAQHFTFNTVLVMLQILCSGIIVIYLDDVLQKGYGLLSGTSLYTATNICGNILWKAFSPMSIIYPEQGTEFEGAVVAWVHLLMTRTDKLSAISKAFYRQNLPTVTDFLATCLFVPLAILFQGVYIILPIRTQNNFQDECHIKLTHFLYGPIVLHRILLALPYAISKVLYMKYSGNIQVNLLGEWNGHIPVGGIMYYLTTPPNLAYLHNDPFHAFIYASFVLITCVFFSMWLILCLPAKGVFNGFVVLNEEQRLRIANADSRTVNEIFSGVMKAACVGCFFAGALIIYADLVGVLGSGTGIMLAVTALYPYVDGSASEIGPFGF